MRRAMTLVSALVASAVMVAGVAVRAGERGSLEGWTSLTLSASKALIFSATTRLVATEAEWPGNGKPAVVLKTKSSARILGATGFSEETTSWIDRANHRPLEFFQLRPGDNARRFVFLDGSVRETTYEPPASAPDSEFDRWKEVETVDRKPAFSDGTHPSPDEPLTDFYSLIYLLRDLDLSSARAPKEFNTLYRRRVVRVRLIPGERRSREIDVVNEATGGQETLRLWQRRIEVKPLGRDAASFRGIMGMQGDTEIWLDEASGAILEIDGDAPGVGATQVLLTSYRR